MCHKLLQVYCCGHTKEVCTTPCTHALTTATPVPAPSPTETLNPPPSLHQQEVPPLARHASTTTASTRRHKEDLPSQGPHGTRTSSLNDTSPPLRLSLSFTPSNLRNSIASLPPPYTRTPSSTSLPNALDPPDRIPNLCAQFFARYLPAGNHPCFSCYMEPAYSALRSRWMRMYVEGHPGLKVEDFGEVERLSGVEGVARSLGLVNVAREVNTADRTLGTGVNEEEGRGQEKVGAERGGEKALEA